MTRMTCPFRALDSTTSLPYSDATTSSPSVPPSRGAAPPPPPPPKKRAPAPKKERVFEELSAEEQLQKTAFEEYAEEKDIEGAPSSKCAGGEEEGVTGEDWGHHQAGLAENDKEEDYVAPRPVREDQGVEVFVEVDKEVNELGEMFHRVSLKLGLIQWDGL